MARMVQTLDFGTRTTLKEMVVWFVPVTYYIASIELRSVISRTCDRSWPFLPWSPADLLGASIVCAIGTYGAHIIETCGVIASPSFSVYPALRSLPVCNFSL